ncbi:MAG: hypothetical protein AAF736_21155, partial [Pseudomonadota bacterium]
STIRTLERLDAAVVGEADLRGPDGQRQITGFVADVGRPPNSLDELLDIGPLAPFANDKTPPGDSDPAISVGGGWRGPYLRLPVGAAALTDGWGQEFEELNADGDAIGDLRILRSRGADRLAGGAGFGRDLFAVFEATAAAAANPELAGQVGVIPSRFEGNVVVGGVVVDDGTDPGDDIGEIAAFGAFVVIRVYGPDPDTGDVRTLSQVVHDLFLDGAGVGATTLPLVAGIPGAGITVGPRVIRAYQVDAAPTIEEDLNPELNPNFPNVRVSRPLYFVNVPGGPPPLSQLVLREIP